jgi:GDP-4-dehydro-6-deoxy-D-mannose reductase
VGGNHGQARAGVRTRPGEPLTRAGLVTGAHGFVGRHLCDHLRACGDDVVGVDRDCDVTSAPSVAGVFEEARPAVIYHLAALTHIGESWANPAEYVRVNVLGTRNVLEAAHAVVKKAVVLFVSTADVYGIVKEDELPLRETHRTAPANPYSQSKLEAELMAKNYARENNQRVIIVRPFNHVGPGQSEKFVVPALVSRLLATLETGATQIPVGDLSTRRDFSDVRDVVRAYRLLVRHGSPGEVYNVASGFDYRLRGHRSRPRQPHRARRPVGTRRAADPTVRGAGDARKF